MWVLSVVFKTFKGEKQRLHVLNLQINKEKWEIKKMMDYTFLLLLISVAWIFLHLLRLLPPRKISSSSNLPPGPLPLPIIGNLHKLGKKPNESLAELAKIHGPLMTLRLGQVTTLVVSSAAVAKEVLQKHDQSLAGRAVLDIVRAIGHHQASMVWLPPNKSWRNLRMLCNSYIFSSQRLDASQGLRRQKVDDLLAHVSSSCRRGQVVDIGRVAFASTLNLLSTTVFSVDLVDIESESTQEFKELVWEILKDAGTPNIVDCFPILTWFDPQRLKRKMAANFKKLHDIFGRLIEERLLSRAKQGEGSRRSDFLDALLDQMEEKGNELTHFDIKSLFVDLFVAGSDTSSDTLEWAMAELLHNPEAMKRARFEIAEVLDPRKRVQESDLSGLPYLHAIVKETLRLHPPVPLLIPHRAESDVEICGFDVPKHTKVLVNAWAIGRDVEVWPEPTCFKPERFLSTQVDYKGQDFELIPFGSGRRICPGLALAERMVRLMLASLLQSFVWELPGGMEPRELDMSDKFGITLQKAIPLLAVPVQCP